MKHLIVSLTIGTCLLFSSAGVVFANDPHPMTNPTGQPGTGGRGGIVQYLDRRPGSHRQQPQLPVRGSTSW